jgi:hypothetical protein
MNVLSLVVLFLVIFPGLCCLLLSFHKLWIYDNNCNSSDHSLDLMATLENLYRQYDCDCPGVSHFEILNAHSSMCRKWLSIRLCYCIGEVSDCYFPKFPWRSLFLNTKCSLFLRYDIKIIVTCRKHTYYLHTLVYAIKSLQPTNCFYLGEEASLWCIWDSEIKRTFPFQYNQLF